VNWIKVSDRLPEVRAGVLAYIHSEDGEKYIDVVAMDSIGMWDNINGIEYCSYEVTHWMPLPEPPEEK
jgi:hypothetical protein